MRSGVVAEDVAASEVMVAARGLEVRVEVGWEVVTEAVARVAETGSRRAAAMTAGTDTAHEAGTDECGGIRRQ